MALEPDQNGPRPRLLDLFCGAGGGAAGYQAAGFYVVGVDIEPQPRYVGDEFHQADALTFDLSGFDAIHASPPCQGYSAMSACRPGLADTYPKLIGPVRGRLGAAGVPYVIENVVGAPLLDPTLLCGAMFGYELYRHRLFETTFPTPLIVHPEHLIPTSDAGHWRPGTVLSVAGHFAPMAKAKEVMAIDWMRRGELAEAIPPYFTKFIGLALVAYLTDTDEEENVA